MSTGGSVQGLLAAALLSVGLVGGALAVGTGDDGSPAAVASRGPAPRVEAVSLGPDGVQPLSQPLVITLRGGQLRDVVVLGPDDVPLEGEISANRWTSTGRLLPSTAYDVTTTGRSTAGDDHRHEQRIRTSEPDQVLTASLSPGDDAVVGVGMPVAVRLDAAVTDDAAREAVEERLEVTSTPKVRGAWRWMNDRELHWRPAEFWPTGTRVAVEADLEGLALPDGVWGSGVRTSRFEIGDEVVSTVDVAAHTMTVTRNGEVLRVLPASMGTPQNPTRGGTHLVIEKYASKVLDSDTVGLPGEYETEVDWAVRLTYSGTFTHAAPWSVAHQGRRNVSHGCVNLSTDDARWFYDNARRGDVVHVVGTDVPPKLDDPGAADWNLTFEEWREAR